MSSGCGREDSYSNGSNKSHSASDVLRRRDKATDDEARGSATNYRGSYGGLLGTQNQPRARAPVEATTVHTLPISRLVYVDLRSDVAYPQPPKDVHQFRVAEAGFFLQRKGRTGRTRSRRERLRRKRYLGE